MSRRAKVYLVGAGVCGKEMLTFKAIELISKADVLVYDRLLEKSVLKLAKPVAKLVYMGKGTGEAQKQAEINRSLVAFAKAGKTVVRLKSGDPFVFGRGGEELKALRREGIEVVPVPGLSSAIALPTLAGIPLTVRGVSSSILILTGHTAMEDEEKYLRGHAKFEGTIVLLMAMGNIRKIASHFLEGGMPEDKAVAIVWTSGCRVDRHFTTLGELERAELPKCPGVIVVGEAVEFARGL